MNNLVIKIPEIIFPFNAGYFISRGAGTHPTRIIDSYEIIFVTSGELDMFEEEEEFHLKAGESLILFPGKKHGGLKRYPANLRFFWLHFGLKDDETSENAVMKIPRKRFIGKKERIVQYFRMYLDIQEENIVDAVYKGLLIYLILMEIYYADNTLALGEEPCELAEKAKRFIEIHFTEDISTSDIAKELKCNADYLGRVYKKSFNTTIIEAINRCRIKLAKNILLNENLNVNEIAEECGYNDISYFRRIFKRETELTPSQYRKMYSRMHVNTE